MNYIITIGLNDKDIKKQLISNEEAIAMLSELSLQYTEGASISTGIGVYRYEDGAKVLENNIILKLLNSNGDVVTRLTNKIKKLLNQESVLIETSTASYEFK